jgi:hypothetical protein
VSRRNAVEVWHVARIEKRGGDLFLHNIDTLKVSYVTTSLNYTQSKVTNKCTKNQTHATQKQKTHNRGGIRRRLLTSSS